jgi:hypothetical protein
MKEFSIFFLIFSFGSGIRNIYTYLECGNKGEPILVDGGWDCNPPLEAVDNKAAVSG